MKENSPSCIRFGVCYFCPVCRSADLSKDGRTANDKQRYKCKKCSKRFITEYSYNACKQAINQKIVTFTKEGLGIRSTARVLKISTNTLLKRIHLISDNIEIPPVSKGKTYEVDEMRIFIGKKTRLRWIVYALERESGRVVSFNVGRRTNRTLWRVIRALELSEAKKIYTDRLKNYRYLIERKVHSTMLYGTNHIERMNLTLRTRLKRLSRRTICFGRSLTVCVAILRICFWG
ncbi:MAG: IS1 family transposase [Prevotellaceae bacterium]|jgi:IS1 family transposase/transposase-like protein|nr:IS1 family transposase [Prevotellaceae bacterium]